MAAEFGTRMYDLLRTVEEINRVAAALPGLAKGVFASISLEMPKLTPAELGCMRLVSWLFVQHFEAGRIGAAFLESKGDAYGHDPEESVRHHRELVQQLRTFLQHNLDSRKPHDRRIQESCERWFRAKCGTGVPSDEAHWSECLRGLLTEAHECLEIMLRIVRSIEADESREMICQEWAIRVERHYPPERFDELIAKVVADMGREGIDPVSLRKRFYDTWSRQLNLLRDDADIATEARRLVEDTVLRLAPRLLPITGKDLIEEFGLGPGPTIGALLEAARRINDEGPCSRRVLIERLRTEVLPSLESKGEPW